MATVKRMRKDNQSGTLGVALTNAGTTITFAAAPGFSTLGTDEYIPLELEAGTTSYEVAYLTAYTAGATTGTIERGKEGTSGVAHGNGTSWHHGPSVKDLETLIARKVYSASAKLDVTGTLADFDATNLAVTFTVPPSGVVKVTMTGAGGQTANSSVWGLREGTTQVGSLQFVANTGILRLTAVVYVTGLTAGEAKTYKWAGKNTGAGTSSVYVGGNGGIDGDAVIEVWAVNL